MKLKNAFEDYNAQYLGGFAWDTTPIQCWWGLVQCYPKVIWQYVSRTLRIAYVMFCQTFKPKDNTIQFMHES